MRRPCAFAFTLVGCLLGLSRAANASPLLETVGAPTSGGGFVARYARPGATSAYFNPALLPRAAPGLTAGAFVLSDQISISIGQRSSAWDSTVGLDASGAFLGDGQLTPVFPPPVPTEWLEYGCQVDCSSRRVENPTQPRPKQGAGSSGDTSGFAVLGLVQPLSGDRLVFGLSVITPIGDVTRATSFYSDEREQYFSNSLHPELYSDRLQTSALAFALAARLTEELSAGVSVTLNLASGANASTFVPDAARFDELRMSNDVRASASLAPHLGVAWQASDTLGLAAALHTVQQFRIDTAFSSLLADGSEQNATQSFTHAYLPWRIGLGGDLTVMKTQEQRLSVTGGVDYAAWSGYVDRHSERPLRGFEWSDTLSPSLGAAWESGKTSAFLDATFAPSPVPAQRGRTSYVDNDRLGFAAGAHWRFSALGAELRAGPTLQVQRLLSRAQLKTVAPGSGNASLVVDEVPDTAVTSSGAPVANRAGLQTNNPGFPGFKSEGYLLMAGAQLQLLL